MARIAAGGYPFPPPDPSLPHHDIMKQHESNLGKIMLHGTEAGEVSAIAIEQRAQDSHRSRLFI